MIKRENQCTKKTLTTGNQNLGQMEISALVEIAKRAKELENEDLNYRARAFFALLCGKLEIEQEKALVQAMGFEHLAE